MPNDPMLARTLGALARRLMAVKTVPGLAPAVGLSLHESIGVERVDIVVGPAKRHGPPVQSNWTAGSAGGSGREFAIRAEIPASTPAGQAGQLTLAFPLDVSHESPIDEALAEAVAGIIALAHRGIQVVTRVASLSRGAHERESSLRKQLGPLVRGRREIIAASKSMREALDAIELASPHTAPVLLRGESGTGKELLARHLHEASPRSAEPFIAINCGAIPGALAESTFFGHEKSAFTGAAARHVGLFERANNGTLFLDEVAELAANVQVKLLRVLQEGTFERVGGTDSHSVDVRIVAATHRPLEDLIVDGTFREDLFYRLSVFPVEVAPLRDRPEDIPLLARAKVKEVAERVGCSPPALSREDIQALLSTPWVGNVRELGNVIERAFILAAGGALQLASVCRSHVEAQGNLTGQRKAAVGNHRPDLSPGTFSDGVRDLLVRALSATGGKVYGPGGAAEVLDLKPSTLQAKLAKLGIDRQSFVPG